MVKDTVQNILQRISDFRGESDVNSDSSRLMSIDSINRDIASRYKWLVHLRRLVEINADGSADYEIGSATYPMQEKGLSEIYVDGTTEDKRYSVVDYFTFYNQYNRNNSARLAYEWYDQANDKWKVHINPAPETGSTVYYSYFYAPAKVTTTTDSVVTPDVNAVIKMALGEIYESEEEYDQGTRFKTDAEQIINDCMGNEETPARNQMYQQGAIESQISSRPIGSY